MSFGLRLVSVRWSVLGLIGALTFGCSAPNESDNTVGGTGGSPLGNGGTTSMPSNGGSNDGTRGGSLSAGGASAGRASGGTANGGATSSGGASGSFDQGGVGAISARAACAAPTAYRNLFVEVLGKSQTDVDTKLTGVVQQLFHGTGSTQPIYYEMGSDQAYIQDIANNDVRSEGQSYGMYIAVAMNMQAEFDKLWKYAATRMRQQTGLFAWQMNTDGTVKSQYAAPDGDEYFAMALLLASKRWGNTTGVDYAGEAKKVLSAIATQGDFNQSPAVVTFGPGNNFSDASYVLPLFYSEWACFDSANAALWKSATTYARTFFQKATDANTGLAPEHSGFDGSPQGDFGPDAWRVPMNIMMDFALNRADPWQSVYATRMALFWKNEGLNNYGSGYTLSGQKTSTGHGAALVGSNAMLAFALAPDDAKPFLQAAWSQAIPTGQYRYYDGCVYMLSMLYLSGKFSLFY